MRRREFIAGLSSAVTFSRAASAQQSAMPVVGWLGYLSPDKVGDVVAGVRLGLAEAGYTEGRNLAIEYRWAEARMERLPSLFAELVQLRVAVIIAIAQPPLADLLAASQSIPIVFFEGVDPVAKGLVASLNRPGGNVTGVSVLNFAVLSKRLEILHELAPTAKRIAYLGNPSTPGLAEAEGVQLKTVAGALGLELLVLHARSPNEFEDAFATLVREQADALIVGQDAMLQRNSEPIAALAVRHRKPAIYASRISALAGGLISYGGVYRDAYRIIGNYTGRILNGEKPADLPVQQLSKVELLINLKAAKALDLTVPPTLLARADEVIE